MTHTTISLLSAAVLTLSVAAGDEWTQGRGKLDGVWIAATRKLNGKETLPADVNVKLVLVNGRFFLITGDRVGAEGVVRIDDQREPKIIDITMTSAERKGQTDLGIYELKTPDKTPFRHAICATESSRIHETMIQEARHGDSICAGGVH